MKKNITLSQVKQIRSLDKSNGGAWIKAMKILAIKFSLTDREILEINRGDFKV